MYPCPGCRAGLRFDIKSQKLVCDHCSNTYSPYEIGREKDAVEHDTFEVTVYTCPQCGGELIADEDTAATFCSYCGGTTILDSKIKKEKRPASIVTFKKTKEDCEEAYGKVVKRAFYTPKEFTNPKQLDKFRAIYMPYWVYDLETNVENLRFSAEKSERKGDYVYTYHYAVMADGEGSTEGINFDASSSFVDALSEGIAPFNMADSQEFTPSFFSGFYADTGDVDKAVYADDANDMVERYNLDQTLKRVKMEGGLTVDHKGQSAIKYATKPALKRIYLAMLPVWFLSYKTKDNRMAYAVVNGQTGRVAADLPVDKKKYFTVSALIALVAFLGLNLFATFTASTLLIIVLVLAALMFFISLGQINSLAKKEKLEDDQGALYAMHLKNMKENLLGLTEDDIQGANQQQINRYTDEKNLALRSAAAVNEHKPVGQREKTKVKKADLAFPVIAFAVALIVTLIKPVDDFIYYGAAIGCIALVVLSQIKLINIHNRLTTRKPPQLGRRGGDENA